MARRAVQPDGKGERPDGDGMLRNLTIDVIMERRGVEALVLDLKRLAASYGLSVTDLEIESVTRKKRSSRSREGS